MAMEEAGQDINPFYTAAPAWRELRLKDAVKRVDSKGPSILNGKQVPFCWDGVEACRGKLLGQVAYVLAGTSEEVAGAEDLAALGSC